MWGDTQEVRLQRQDLDKSVKFGLQAMGNPSLI